MDRSGSGVEWLGYRMEEAIGWVNQRGMCLGHALAGFVHVLIADRASQLVTQSR
jgi:hypothetical protein